MSVDNLLHLARSSGGVLYLIIAVLFVALTIIVERYWFLHRLAASSQRSADDVEKLNHLDAPLLSRLAEQYRGLPVASLLLTAARFKENKHRDQLEARLEEAIMREAPRIDRMLWLLDTIVTLAPLLGLLGTIIGMFNAFQVLSNPGNAPTQVTGGVGGSAHRHGLRLIRRDDRAGLFQRLAQPRASHRAPTRNAQGDARQPAGRRQRCRATQGPARRLAPGNRQARLAGRRTMKYFEVRKARIEIIPMIDIMFFLLVFFIMVTLHMIPNAGLHTDLPSSASAEQTPPPKVLVTLAADGVASVDGKIVSLAQLTALLAARPDPSHTLVSIAGSKEVQLQKLVSVMDACRAANVTQVSLATQPAAQ